MLINPIIELLKSHIRNYRRFYRQKYNVDRREIFSSAAVPAQELAALCVGTPKIRIYLAKTDVSKRYEMPGAVVAELDATESSAMDEYGGITMIIARADEKGKTFLNDPSRPVIFMESTCCHNPPGSDWHGSENEE